MMIRNSRPLPAPYSEVSVGAEEHDWGVLVEYVGPNLQALQNAGCITSMMAEQFSVSLRGRARVDEHGNLFSKFRRPLKGSPDRISLARYIRGRREDALALPGVTEALLASGPPAKVRVSARGATTGMVARTRTVGRLQRPVKWSVVGAKLIVIDWVAVQAAAISQRVYT